MESLAQKVSRSLRRIGAGYRRAALRVATVAAAGAALLLAAFVVVFPLWWFAREAPQLYTAALITLPVVAAPIVLYRRMKGRWSRAHVLPILKTGGTIAAVVVFGYIAIMLFAAGQSAPAAAITIAILLWVGYNCAPAGGGSTRSAPRR